MTYYLVTTAILAVALFFPTSRLIHVLAVRRLERKRGSRLNEAEIRGQRRRARFLAAVVVVVFAALFNYNVFGIPRP